MSEDDPTTGRRFLTGSAYADDRHIRSRMGIYAYAEKTGDPRWRTSVIPWDGTQIVADVGCGNGFDLRHIVPQGRCRHAIGLDLSAGMLRSLEDLRQPGGLSLVQADAERLPLPDRAVDVAMAMHMLYHVPDIDRAGGELARVLRPGGVAIVATNGEGHMRQFGDLLAAAVSAVEPGAVAREQAFASAVGHRFRLENGPGMLRQHFASAEIASWQTEMRIPEPGPVVAYLDSQRAGRADRLPAGVSWEAMLAAARAITDEIIARDGAFTADSHSGFIVCRGPRSRS